jgi:hypothetical protein
MQRCIPEGEKILRRLISSFSSSSAFYSPPKFLEFSRQHCWRSASSVSMYSDSVFSCQEKSARETQKKKRQKATQANRSSLGWRDKSVARDGAHSRSRHTHSDFVEHSVRGGGSKALNVRVVHVID